MIATSYQGLLYLPHFVCTLLREPCKQQKAQISLRILQGEGGGGVKLILDGGSYQFFF